MVRVDVLRCGLKVDNIKPQEIVSLSPLATMKSCTVLPSKMQILLLTTLKALPGLQERSLPLPETARDIHFLALDEVLTGNMQIILVSSPFQG